MGGVLFKSGVSIEPIRYIILLFFDRGLFQKNSETNDDSFESTNLEPFESGKKLSMASSLGLPA